MMSESVTLPGLLDIQVNGYAGLDLNEPDLDSSTVTRLVSVLREAGTTRFCPTLITAEPGQLLASLATIARVRAGDTNLGAAMPAIHMEGPYLSSLPGARGAHDPALMRPADVAEFDRWWDAAEGAIGIVTIAPEVPGAIEFISEVNARGVVVAIGHTAAEPEVIAAAVDAGVRLSTHLGNGAAADLPRHPNLLWTQLADDRLQASLIADGHHLPADTFTVMTRAKGARCLLISDSAALGGLPPGLYDTPVGGRVQVHEDGRLVLPGSRLLAGSGATLLQCLGWAVNYAGIEWEEAVAMASTRPARLLGLSAGDDQVRAHWNQDRLVVDSVDRVSR